MYLNLPDLPELDDLLIPAPPAKLFGGTVRRAVNETLRQLRGQPVSLTRLGLSPGMDARAKIQEFMDTAPKGSMLLVPPAPNTGDADSYHIKGTLTWRTGISIIGMTTKDACQLRRHSSSTDLLWKAEGPSSGKLGLDAINNVMVTNLSFHGGGRGYDLAEALNCGAWLVANSAFRGVASGGRLFRIRGQFQDSLFDNVFAGGGGGVRAGVTDAVASIEITDIESDGGHVQNLVWRRLHGETYYADLLRVYGRSQDGLNSFPTLMQFLDTKLESPDANPNFPDINLLDGGSIDIQLRQIVSKGTAGQTKDCIIYCNARDTDIRGKVAHEGGGAALTTIIRTGPRATGCDFTIKNDAATRAAVTSNALAQLGATDGVRVWFSDSTNKMMCWPQLSMTNRVIQNIRTVAAVFASVARETSDGVLTMASRSVRFIGDYNATTKPLGVRDMFVGGDSANRVTVASTANLDDDAYGGIDQDGALFTKAAALKLFDRKETSTQQNGYQSAQRNVIFSKVEPNGAVSGYPGSICFITEPGAASFMWRREPASGQPALANTPGTDNWVKKL